MNLTLLRETVDMEKALIINIGFDYYLVLDDEDMSQAHEIKHDFELYPTEYYIYLDYDEVVPFCFDLDEITNEYTFDTYEEAENFLERRCNG